MCFITYGHIITLHIILNIPEFLSHHKIRLQLENSWDVFCLFDCRPPSRPSRVRMLQRQHRQWLIGGNCCWRTIRILPPSYLVRVCVSPWTRWQEPSQTRVTVNAADFTWAQFVAVTSFRDWQLHGNCGYFLEWQFKLSPQLCIKHIEAWLGRHAFFSSLTSYFPNWNLNILAFQRSLWTSQLWSAKGVFLNEKSASLVKRLWELHPSEKNDSGTSPCNYFTCLIILAFVIFCRLTFKTQAS